MSRRVAGHADTEVVAVFLAYVPDQILRVLEVVVGGIIVRDSLRRISSETEKILNSVRLRLVQRGVNLLLGQTPAGDMHQHVHSDVILNVGAEE